MKEKEMKVSVRNTIIVFYVVLSLLTAACSTASVPDKSTEPVYESTGYEWYAFLGEWRQGDDYLEFFEDDTFYDSRYDLSGTWDESHDGGDVILIYDGFPDFIYDTEDWADDEKYFECYCLDYDDGVLFDPDNSENVWYQ